MGLPSRKRFSVGTADSSDTGREGVRKGWDGIIPGLAGRTALRHRRTCSRRRVAFLCRGSGRRRRAAWLGEKSARRPRRDLGRRRRGGARTIRASRPARAASRARRAGRGRRERADRTQYGLQHQMTMDQLKAKIRSVPDFPKAGILFYDITTLLQDAAGFRAAIDSLAIPFQDQAIEVVVAVESRGFIFGAAVADRIHAGFTPVRKPGKLPSKTVRCSYALEYGTDSLEMHRDAVRAGQRVLIVDDLLATGGTAAAATDPVKELGGEVYALAFLIELTALNGRQRLAGEQIYTVLKY